jgi:hypothetical protein
MIDRTDAEATRDTAIAQLQEDVKSLTEELAGYRTFIKLMIEREEDRKKLRRAIIEKSLTTLSVSMVTAILVMLTAGVKEWIKNLK